MLNSLTSLFRPWNLIVLVFTFSSVSTFLLYELFLEWNSTKASSRMAFPTSLQFVFWKPNLFAHIYACVHKFIVTTIVIIFIISFYNYIHAALFSKRKFKSIKKLVLGWNFWPLLLCLLHMKRSRLHTTWLLSLNKVSESWNCIVLYLYVAFHVFET